MNYFKRLWNETSGDALTDNWGTSTYYFEIGADTYPIRQVQIFENGKALKYHDHHKDDDYGGLSDQPLDIEEFEEFKIDPSEFENIWATTNHL